MSTNSETSEDYDFFTKGDQFSAQLDDTNVSEIHNL